MPRPHNRLQIPPYRSRRLRRLRLQAALFILMLAFVLSLCFLLMGCAIPCQPVLSLQNPAFNANPDQDSMVKCVGFKCYLEF